MAKKPPPTPEEVQTEKKAKTLRIGAATRRRTKWETANPDRMKSVTDQPIGTSGKTAAEHGISPKTMYGLLGYHDLQPPGNSPGQAELPGMGSVAEARAHGTLSGSASPAYQSRTFPDQAPTKASWEDMTHAQRTETLGRAREYGVTPESLHRSYGAQVDQAYARGASHGMTPYASHFYSGDDPSRPSPELPAREVLNHPDYQPPPDMQPKDVLRHSAKANDVDFGTQALANGITSNKSKFRMRRKSGGTAYPNDEAATFAIKAVQGGTAPKAIDPSGHGIIALHNRVQTAGHVVQQREAGVPLSEVRNFPSKADPRGTLVFGGSPKIGPYTNSWMDPAGSSQRFVSDTHSGGGGMAPHLNPENAYQRDEGGGIALTSGGRGKKQDNGSEREQYLTIPGIHSLHDHIARQVHAERGLGSLAGGQGAQWGEEQLARGEGVGGWRPQTLVKPEDAYPKAEPTPEVSGQQDLFHDRRGG